MGILVALLILFKAAMYTWTISQPIVEELLEPPPQIQATAVAIEEIPPEVLAPQPPGEGVIYSLLVKHWGELADKAYRVVSCETGGTFDPTIVGVASDGTRYHGLFQFYTPTWQAMGGVGTASGASVEEQIIRARALYDYELEKFGYGWGAWPYCGKQ